MSSNVSTHAAAWLCGVLVSAAGARAQLSNPIPAPIAKGGVQIELKPVATGLLAPNDLTTAPGDAQRLFVTDQGGKVRLIQGGVLQSQSFLDVSGRLVGLNGGYDERGLLGLAFHPGYANPASPGYRKLYTYTSEPVGSAADFTVPMPVGTAFDHQSVLAEWQVSAANPNLVDVATRREVMRIDEPQSNHNGGMLAFGADARLYMSLGDGGAGNDVGAGHTASTGNAQDTSNVLGKILRIDVDGRSSGNGQYAVPGDNPFAGGGGVAEIYAYGLRNPFRFGFDAPTGQLLVADVGQNNIEELNRVTAGGNYGWHVKEGTFLFDPASGAVTANSPGSPAGLIDPILQYDHDEGRAMIGGYVYHGTAVPALVGKYVFGDLSNGFAAPAGRLFYADLDTGLIQELTLGTDDRALGLFVKGFGQDAAGELYVLASTNLGPSGTTGQVLQIVAVPEPAGVGLVMLGGGVWLLRRRRPSGTEVAARAAN